MTDTHAAPSNHRPQSGHKVKASTKATCRCCRQLVVNCVRLSANRCVSDDRQVAPEPTIDNDKMDDNMDAQRQDHDNMVA